MVADSFFANIFRVSYFSNFFSFSWAFWWHKWVMSLVEHQFVRNVSSSNSRLVHFKVFDQTRGCNADTRMILHFFGKTTLFYNSSFVLK